MKLIINCDDLGLTYGFTKAIKDSYLKGITTSTSIRTNGYAYKYAKRLLKGPLKNIGLGLHINLTQGPAYAQELADNSGNYKYNFFQYFFHTNRLNKKLLASIEEDVEMQFEIAFKKDRLVLDHISGHDHVHMIPPIFEIISRVSQKYGLKRIRLTSENFYLVPSLKENLVPLINTNLLKLMVLTILSHLVSNILNKYKLKTTSGFYGVLHTNNMNLKTVKAALNDALSHNASSIEIDLHPAYPKHPKDKKYLDPLIAWYTNLGQRKVEFNTLVSKDLKDFIKRNKINLVSYREI